MLEWCTAARGTTPYGTRAWHDRRWLSLCLAVLLTSVLPGRTGMPLSAQAPDQVTSRLEIPMELLAGRPLVRGTIDGQGPFGLLIDPRVGITHVTPAVTELWKPAPPGTSLAVELVLGEYTIDDVPVEVRQTPDPVPELGARAQPDGVLSLSVWRDQLVTLDYRRWRIQIEPGALPEPNGHDVFALRPESQELRVYLKIGDRVIECRVDPWFPGGLVLPRSYLAEFELASEPKDVAPVAMREGVVAAQQARLAETVVVADVEYPSPLALFGDIGDTAVLGYGWLKRLAVTYDLALGRARLTSGELLAHVDRDYNGSVFANSNETSKPN